MKYKVGDKVKVRKDLKINYNHRDVYSCVSHMLNYRGKILTIGLIDQFGYRVKENGFGWSDYMLENIEILEDVNKFVPGEIVQVKMHKTWYDCKYLTEYNGKYFVLPIHGLETMAMCYEEIRKKPRELNEQNDNELVDLLKDVVEDLLGAYLHSSEYYDKNEFPKEEWNEELKEWCSSNAAKTLRAIHKLDPTYKHEYLKDALKYE